MNIRLNRLILLNIVLLVLIIVSLNISQQSGSIQIPTFLFSLNKINLVDKLVIGEAILKKQKNNQWIINDKYQVDPSKIQLLLSIMQNIEIKKEVAESSKKDRMKSLLSVGKKVEVYSDNKLLKSYQLFSERENTYASLEGEKIPYQVYTPNYFENVYNFYNIDPWAWRDKRVLHTQWRTLKKLVVTYYRDNENSFTIKFNEDFYKVEKVNQLDSVALYNYISNYENFRVYSFVKNSFSLKDSLAILPPVCIIKLEDLYTERNKNLIIYPGSPFFYGMIEDSDEVVKLSKELMRKVLVNRDYFRKK